MLFILIKSLLIGIQSENSSVTGVEIVGAREQAAEQIIAIITATPSPVEMEIVHIVIPVAHKSMATRAGASIGDGAQLVQLLLQALHPSAAVIVTREVLAGRIAEILLHDGWHV